MNGAIRVDANGRTVRRKVAVDPGSIRRIEREARVLEALDVRGVVDLSGCRLDGTASWLETFVVGTRTLADASSTPGAASGSHDVLDIGAAVLAVLQGLHESGWAHGSIRAEHCILTAPGRITLCSLADAVQIDSTHAPAALADVRAVAAMLVGLPHGRTDPRVSALLERMSATGPGRHTAAQALAELTASTPAPVRSGRVALNQASRVRRPRSHQARPEHPRHQNTPRAIRQRRRIATRLAVRAACYGLLSLALLRLGRWENRPNDKVAELLRMTAAALSGLVALSCIAGLVAIATWRRSEVRSIAEWSPLWLRRIALGASAAAALATVAASSGASAPPAATYAGRRPAPRPHATTTADHDLDTPPHTNRPEATLAPAEGAGADIASRAATFDSDAPDLRLVVVEQGDHLWGIAETALTSHWGRTPTDAEIAPYWIDLIEMNRASLVDPSNPDLIRVGQIIELPPIPDP